MVQVLVDHRRVVCSLTAILELWLDHVDARLKEFSGVCQLAPPEVELDIDTPNASMALHVSCSLSNTAHSRSAS